MPLYRERITSIAPKVNPCTFITELTMNLIYIPGGHQSEVSTVNELNMNFNKFGSS